MRLFMVILSIFVTGLVYASERLVFTIDLIRHGARASNYAIPGEPFPWKEGRGQLTAEGANQELQLGQTVRKEYVEESKLLPSRYDPNTLYVRSTISGRVVKSAEAFLMGLYPMEYRGLPHTTIPIHEFATKDDKLLITRPYSSPWSLLRCYLANRKHWKDKTAMIQDKLRYWGQQGGIPLTSFYQMDKLADNLSIRLRDHLPLPTGFRREDADEIISISDYATLKKYRLHLITEPMGQAFLQEVVRYFDLASHHKTPLKSVLYFGHDSSIMNVMNTLGAPVDKVPDFASRLNFSLYENNHQFYVTISLNGKPVSVSTCKGNTCLLSQIQQLADR
jgi:acid phosphatase